MASLGHLAVGLLAGRFQDDGRMPHARPRGRTTTLIGFSLLAMLPDADVFFTPLGSHDSIMAGHRGASHSLLMAATIAVAGGLLARRYGWSGIRTMLAVLLAIGSHGLLDALGEGGRAIPLFWPLSDHRFRAPWQFLPDAPRGLKFISWHGLVDAVLEFVYFLPVILLALWPRAAVRVAHLAVLAGDVSEPNTLPVALPAPGPAPVVAARPDTDLESERAEPPLRSLG
jgi:inner membrane protein